MSARVRPTSAASASGEVGAVCHSVSTARGGVDQRGLPGLVGDRHRALPGERRRHQQQALVGERRARRVRALDPQLAVAPLDHVVKVGELRVGAAARQPPGVVLDVGLEQRLDARPVRLDRALPVLGERVAQAAELPARVVEQRLHRRGYAAPAEADPHLLAHARGRRSPHQLELLADLGQRAARRRGDEVRRIAPRRYQLDRREQVDAAEVAAQLLDPGQVEGRPRRLHQRAQALRQLEQRRDREVRAGQALDPEFEDDHSAQAKSIDGSARVAEPHLMIHPALTNEMARERSRDHRAAAHRARARRAVRSLRFAVRPAPADARR